MPNVEEGLRAQVRNIEAAYGRPIEGWVELIRASGLTKHSEVVAMLKAEHGMTHAAAHRVSLVARQPQTAAAGDPAERLVEETRAALRPVVACLMAAVRALGDDVELAPKRGYVSLRRRTQFAMIQPGAAYVNLGLVLKDVPAAGRLEPASGFNALFTHRVRVPAPDEVDEELVAWLRKAYCRAG